MTLITGDPQVFRAGNKAALIVLTQASTTPDLNANPATNLMPWDTQITVGPGFAHDTSAPTRTRINIRRGGWYLLGVNIVHEMATPGAARYRGSLSIRRNGTTTIAGRAKTEYLDGGSATNEGSMLWTRPVLLVASDYIEVVIDRVAAYTGQVNPIANESEFWMTYLGRP